VVGTSGSGKSSLVRSGLIPSLQSGFMAGTGSSWRIATHRPGEDPLGQLAAALQHPDVLGVDDELATTRRVLIEASLRRGSKGLVEAVALARVPSDHNVLVVVDQFEELFRFRASRQHEHSRDEAVAFVRLLLEATRQRELPIYVVLTMRSDFISECMHFPGLSEAVNAGLYLVGRMGRDQLRSAITGPVAVGGGAISPRLVHHVLNDLGDDHDQLPLVQHALMRTWDHWARHTSGSRPLDIEDYEAVGAVQDALSRHAEEAYDEALATGGGTTAEHMFRALTDTVTDGRGVRRPTSVGELAAVCQVTEEEIIGVVDIFRRAGRSFLMPPAGVPLTSHAIVDLSHESLMRCWTRLIGWAEEERAAAAFYVRLSQAAAWHEQGTAGLWRNPELELAARWEEETRPTAAWARRYDDSFERSLAFLNRSRQEQTRLDAEREAERRARLRRAHAVAAVLGLFLAVAVLLAWVAWQANIRAEANLALARAAVDESLSAADRDPAAVGADVPELQDFRRELLEKAERFYTAFMQQDPRTEASRRDLALAHLRLGHIDRLLHRRAEASTRYREAIDRFDRLAADFPARLEYRQALANAYNWLGETLRPVAAEAQAAEAAYGRALELQRALVQEDPATPIYQRELARTRYNRGILHALETGRPDLAEEDFREAIQLLEPIAPSQPAAAQDLARALNNLAGLLAVDAVDEADALYQRAIDIDERLVAAHPGNREYKLELAKFHNNLAALASDRGHHDRAEAHSQRAIVLLDDLARLAPSLAIERADARSLRGMILEQSDPGAGARAYADALALFAELRTDRTVQVLPDFHLRFGDLLLNLAAATAAGRPGAQAARADLVRAVDLYADVAGGVAASGSEAGHQAVEETLSRVLPHLPEAERERLLPLVDQLQNHRQRRHP
jgi:tetratricopeptide (TPR) repeat protein